MAGTTPLARLLARNHDGDDDMVDIQRWNELFTLASLQDVRRASLTAADALTLGDEFWMEILNINYIEARKFGNWLGRTLCPKLTTITHEHNHHPFSTGLPRLDVCLRGGFMPGHVTELVGEAGMGKTQFCLTASARVAMENKGVIYIDTEGKFSVHRLVQIIIELGGNEECAARVLVLRAHSFDMTTLLQEMQGLDTLIIAHDVKLLVLDSVAATARVEFGSDQLFERQQALSKQAAVLKSFAETFHLLVLLTNQVIGGGTTTTTTTIGDVSRLMSDRNGVNAALGNTWAHCVNVRLALEKDAKAGIRHVRVVKSPMCLETVIPYEVTACGITQT